MTPPYPDEINDNIPCNECLQDPCICEISEADYYDDEYNDDLNDIDDWNNDNDELDNERRNNL